MNTFITIMVAGSMGYCMGRIFGFTKGLKAGYKGCKEISSDAEKWQAVCIDKFVDTMLTIAASGDDGPAVLDNPEQRAAIKAEICANIRKSLTTKGEGCQEHTSGE